MVYVIIWTCFFVKFWEFFIIFQKYWTINQLIIVKLRDCRQNLLIIFSKFKQINQFLFSLKLSQNLWSLSYRKPKATVSKETLAKNVVICRFRMFSKKYPWEPQVSFWLRFIPSVLVPSYWHFKIGLLSLSPSPQQQYFNVLKTLTLHSP